MSRRLRKFATAAALGGFFISCASSVSTQLGRRCLFDRPPRGTYRTGTVIEVRDDGARLFRFDRRDEGDHGYQWIASEDARLRPCKEASSWAPPNEGFDRKDPLHGASPNPDR